MRAFLFPEFIGANTLINNDWKHLENVLEKVERLRPKFLEYIDKNNSKRVYELIEQKLGEKNARK